MNKRTQLLAVTLMLSIARFAIGGANPSSFNVRDYGAQGDGKALDTKSLNKAIDACAAAGGGEVLVPAGKYLTGTVHLKSNMTIVIDAGAEVIGTRDLDQYENFTPPKDTPLVGSRVEWHRALILGNGIENVTIAGCGTINGANVSDPQGEEHIRGPHGILFGNCKNITLRDISIRDAGNYAVLLEFTSDVEVRGVKITGGYDGVHFRGWKGHPCRNVTISDSEFYTGDDCIAGWYWQDTLIDRCVLNSACSGIRLFGPAQRAIVHDCLFFGPGRFEWRSTMPLHRKEMADGIVIQPSAWGETEGAVDDLHISDVVMHDVGSPLHVVAKAPSTIGRVTIDRVTATGIYRAAASFESWTDAPIGRIDLRNSSLQFVGGFGPILSDPTGAALALLDAQPTSDVRAPGVNSRRLPAWGIYARHVASLNLVDVRLSVDKTDQRPALIFDGVDALTLDGLRWPRGLSLPMTLKNVRNVNAEGNVQTPIVQAKCLRLSAAPDQTTITVTVRSEKDGLAKIVLELDGKAVTRWSWMIAGKPCDVLFEKVPKQTAGAHNVECGDVRLEMKPPAVN
jgi:hypothetical protein